MIRLNKKIALITGASEGIGKSIALKFASENISLYLLSRSKDKLLKLKSLIIKKYSNCEVIIIPFNMENEFSNKIYNFCKKRMGLPNILINNSGGPEPGNFLKIKKKNWDKTINRNLMSVINLSTIFSKKMIKEKWGRLITISSTVAKQPSPIMVQSATVRAAALAFNKSISFDLAKYNITNNTILLGGVETNRLKKLIKLQSKKNKINIKKYKNKLLSSIPAGRFADPDEIASLVNFLVSSEADYINGQSIVIDGGLSKFI